MLILQACEKVDAYLVVDEAYYEYSGVTLGLLQASFHPHLFILRTFSKFDSMAGLRLGYAVSTSENIRRLRDIKSVLPFNVSHIAKVFGVPIFKLVNDHRDHILNKFIEAKSYLCSGLDSIGVSYLPSLANFITVNFGDSVALVIETLEKEGVLIRSCKEWNMHHFARITVGTKDEIDIFMEKLLLGLDESDC